MLKFGIFDLYDEIVSIHLKYMLHIANRYIPYVIVKYKDVFWQLTFREIKARYKQSILGFAWAILVPLLNLLVLSVVFSNLFKIPTGGVPYPVYLFVALVPWTFFSNAILASTSSIISNAALITKIYLPREIFPISTVTSKLVDLFLTSVVLFVFLIFYGVSIKITFIYLPLILLIQLILMLGIAFILSATNVYFRDIENVQGVFMTIWLYLTPVIYSPSLIPENLRLIFFINPMTGIINAYRDVILYNISPLNLNFLYSFFASILIFIVGFLFFKNSSKFFADVI